MGIVIHIITRCLVRQGVALCVSTKISVLLTGLQHIVDRNCSSLRFIDVVSYW